MDAVNGYANPEHLFGISLKAFERGDFAGALEILNGVAAERPDFAAAHNLIGICNLQLGQFSAAERALLKAIAVSESGAFYANLGLIYLCGGNLERAAEAYRTSLYLDPSSPEICNNLGNILCTFNQHQEALQYYRQAVRIQPHVAQWHHNLGTCLFRLHQIEEAEPVLRTALQLDGGNAESRRKLADLLVQNSRFEEAFEQYRTIGAWGWLQFAMRMSVSWRGLEDVDAAFINELKVGAATPVSPWCLLNVPGLAPELEKRAAHSFAVATISGLREPPVATYRNAPAAAERLRIGYLSSDFYNHATAYLLAGVLEMHDRSAHEIILFSYGDQHDDQCSRRLHAAGFPVVDLSGMSDRKAAEEIANHKIDIVIEMKGHTGAARLGITALRPAPIIVSWLGHPGTLGHERLADYIIGDPIVTPPEDSGFFSERLALMPNCYQPNDSSRPLPEAPARALAGLPESGLVFCSFNQSPKFNPGTFDLWARLLNDHADSVLWLRHFDDSNMNVLREFEARGVQSKRIIFAQPASQIEHIARLRLADIALDTFPCTSHTTASDALWAGVPLVTLKGKTFTSRVAASILTTHGLPELVTDTEEDYFDLASDLASNEEKRADIKARIESARTTSPLFDTARFTRDLEQLLRRIVDDHSHPASDRRFVTI